MYENYWGLREPPFAATTGEPALFATPGREEALARLHFLASGRRRLGLLLGDWGVGKSLVLDVFADQLRGNPRRVAKVSALGIDVCEFLASIAMAWGHNVEAERGGRELWQAVADRLAEHQYQRLASVVLVDDADEASAEVLAQLARLAQRPVPADAHLTMVLAARRSGVHRLGRRLLELADLRIDLWPWEAPDVRSYIDHALSRAGRNEPAFDSEALSRLHELSHGIPRRVQQLAELALVAAAGKKLPHVDVHTLEGVFEELAIAEPAGRI
jgi:general secretion pathway protein A